jgi:hypothetical protein
MTAELEPPDASTIRLGGNMEPSLKGEAGLTLILI